MSAILGVPMFRGKSDSVIGATITLSDFEEVPEVAIGGIAISFDSSARHKKAIPFDVTKGFGGFINGADIDVESGLIGVTMSGIDVPVLKAEEFSSDLTVGLNEAGRAVPTSSADCVYILNGSTAGVEENAVGGNMRGIISSIKITFNMGGHPVVNVTGAVTSVNGKTGAVVLDADSVGALPDSYVAPVTSVNGEAGVVVLDAAKVGALPDSYTAPVTTVNGESGVVVLDATSVGALADAASDGKQYARQDATWTEVTAGAKSNTGKK
jgi:hypothetical protein